MAEAMTWLFGIAAVLVMGAALIYILGFIFSMVFRAFYGLFKGAENMGHHMHTPNIHMPHRHRPAATH